MSGAEEAVLSIVFTIVLLICNVFIYFVCVLSKIGEGSHWCQRKHASGDPQRPSPLWGLGFEKVAV